ncbi:MAG: DUF3567 domain-containing protein [Serpentinimonas sp.]|nr:MAG: hypothetical protein JM57_04700 [Comamonadaceae bacterium BICA1-1]MDO8275097.1 DUF3567 domain-containing protein [Serpentinimonas sp.]MDO9612077.1 DUF3567 domain-containing protein [Serpentinimonas sp.]
MQTLYDSDTFVVVHILAHADSVRSDVLAPAGPDGKTAGAVNPPTTHQMPRHGFEIVDKRSGKEVYLDGSWAELFQQQIHSWQRDTPTQEEVEDTLEGYATLAQTPVAVH